MNLLIPGLPPAGWFPGYGSPAAYDVLTDELRPIISHVWNHAVRDTAPEAADAVAMLARHPAMTWMAASAYAWAAVVNGPLLPQRHYLSVQVPADPGGLPRAQREQVSRTASGFLTAAARGHLAAPVTDHDHDAVVALIDTLVYVALIGHRTLEAPVMVVAEPVRDVAGPAPWITYNANGTVRVRPKLKRKPARR